ncbi:ABC transporter permease [Gammaproteobacteria bacterium]|nr:ABC transporter permease [Gammaproteobacteria bacterium]
MTSTLIMAKTFLKLFSRDRQAIFFSLFFPIIFMSVFGLVGNSDSDPIQVGIINNSNSSLASDFIERLNSNPLFTITEGNNESLRTQLVAGDLTLIVVLPENFQDNGAPVDLTLLVDASETRQLALIMPVVEQALIGVERQLRNIEPLFSISVEDVQSRSQSYLDFVVPGLLAFTLMQISIAGSGFNIVEFRRKGILKRLFVTPIEPKDFIGGLVISRLILCLLQLSILLGVAVFVLDVTIVGNFFSLYLIILAGTVIFLSIGFSLGSLAKTQQSIMAIGNLVTFPQILLSGVFYPISALPELIQPLAKLLPLSFVVTGLREIAINGLSLFEMLPNLLGLFVWLVITLLIAIKLFVWKDVAS